MISWKSEARYTVIGPALSCLRRCQSPVWLSLRCYLTSISLGIYPSLPLMEYGKRFQKHRKLFHSVFSRIEIGKFEEPLVEEARFLAKSIIEKPASYNWLVRRSASCITSRTMKTDLSCCLKICDSLSHGCRVRSPNSVRRRSVLEDRQWFLRCDRRLRKPRHNTARSLALL